MMEDAIESDYQFAMVKMMPEVEGESLKSPPIESGACLGKIHDYRRLEDGRFNLLLVGVQRIRIIEELPLRRLYREARFDPIEDILPTSDEPIKSQLFEAYESLRLHLGMAEDDIVSLYRQNPPLTVFLDLMSHGLGIPVSVKQELLEDPCVQSRALRLLKLLDEQNPGSNSVRVPFPPPFSNN